MQAYTDTNITITEDDNAYASSVLPTGESCRYRKIWECFTDLLEEDGPTSDTCGGVETMVDRCLYGPLKLIGYKSSGGLKINGGKKTRVKSHCL